MSLASQIQTRLKKYAWILVLIVIVGYASYLRIYGLSIQSFWIDEGFSSYVSKYVFLGSWTQTFEYYLHIWAQVASFHIGEINQWRARIPSVIASILTMVLMYILPYKLYKDKRIALLSVVLFGFLYREIAWARQARFYAILQLLFVGGITLITYRIQTKKIRFLNRSLLVIYIGILFHPFLYSLVAVMILAIIYQYPRSRKIKDLRSREYRCTWIILGVLLVHYLSLKFLAGGGYIPRNDVALSRSQKYNYLKYYNRHLLSELGVGYIVGVGGMFRSLYKKNYKDLILLIFPFVMLRILLIFKGYMMHYRYALLMYPLLIIMGSVVSLRAIEHISKKYIKLIVSLILIILVGYTGRWQILPTSHYWLDFTSPQPDFQSAYKTIPDGQKVISGFPTLCDRYYANRGNCYASIKVDIVNNGGSQQLLLATNERYTKSQYLQNINQLAGGTYYFVLDNLTQKSSLSPELYQYILTKGKKISQSGTGHLNIIVYKIELP